MAYPPPGPEIEVERVRSDVPLSGICHYDMLDGNCKQPPLSPVVRIVLIANVY